MVVTNVSCNGGNNGAVNLSVLGGTSPYTYLWSDNATTEDISGLVAGIYIVTITDVNGCHVIDTAHISQPAGLSLSITGSNISCFGANTGSVDLSVTGGTFPYTYLWSNGILNQDLSGVTAGLYSVTVTDANGCTATSSITLTQPTLLTASTSVTTFFGGYGVSCNGSANANITVTVSGGTAGYTYYWSNNATTQNLTGVGAGTYFVTVTDTNGCKANSSAVVTQPALLTATAAITSNYNGYGISCNGGNNGSISLTVAGGLTSYTYHWSNNATTQNLSGVAAGTYSVTVTDQNNCTATASAVLTQPAALTATATVSSNYNGYGISCNGASNGSISLTTTGGVTVYIYHWSNNATTQNLSGVAAGTYTVTITDQNGCTVTSSATLTQPVVLATTAAVSSNYNGYGISCNGGSNGNISLTITGGLTSYSYHWSNNASTQNLTGVIAGTYTVTVTDINGCTATSSATLTQPTALSASAAVSTNFNGYSVSCNGSTNGGITLTVAGGLTAYTYHWSNNATTQNLTAIGAGTYSVTITDLNGCTATATATLTQPSVLTATATITSNFGGYSVSCNGSTNGSISLVPSGGVTAYIYHWSNNATTQNLSNIGAGTYTVTVTDLNSCTFTTSVTLTQPLAIIATATVTSNYNGYGVSCNGGSNGSINLAVSNGISPYFYHWSNNSNVQNLVNVIAGIYTVTVNDIYGCTATATATLTQPAALAATATVTSNFNGYGVGCNGATNGTISLVVSGGLTAYTYHWSNNATTQNLSGVGAGTYTVTITDLNGCTVTASATLTQPPAITATATITSNFNGYSVSCNGSTNGSISLSVSGGATPYIYHWSNNATTQNLSNIGAGTFAVTVTDLNNCTQTTSVTLTQPSAISATATVNSNYNGYGVSCFGETNGSIHLTASGGITPYFYNWSNNDNTQNLNNAGAGVYTVTVTDQNGCTKTATATLTQPVEMIAVANVSTNYNGYGVSCYGASNGAINLTITGGITPLIYNWSNGATTHNISNIAAGIYSVTVTDLNGCQSVASIIITGPLALQASAVVTTDYNGYSVSCYDATNGNVDLMVDFGVTPYSYHWSNGATTQNLVNIGAGSYTVTITDANGCTQETGVTLTQPSMITSNISLPLTYNGNGVSCHGATDANISLVVTGGLGSYTFHWSNDATTQSLTNVGAGTYTVSITDLNGCIVTNSITVSEPPLLTLLLTPVNVTCYGLNDGSITTTVTGGTTPYSYDWSNTAIIENLVNLGPGTYSLTLTDVNNCTVTGQDVITEPTAIMVTDTAITHQGCANENSGAIDITVAGGSTPYTFHWSNGDTTEDLANVAAGNYTVTITDAHGCSHVETYTILPGIAGPVAYFQFVEASGIVTFINFSTPTQAVDTTVTYLWNFGDTIGIDTSTAFQPWHQYTVSAMYIVTLTVTNACGTSTYTDTIYVRLTDIPEIPGNEISINLFPNPNNGIFTMSYESTLPTGEINIRIFDVSGQVLSVDHFIIEGTKFTHDYNISRYSVGMYFIEISNKDGVQVRRIIMDRK
ncbi:MAG: T9SS type A sorting domain-containing protein, partial [Bacteroidia bacterium]|nr:T9SS type A sorting domain-containing protein [Bacteroidia bacterium]